MKKLVCFAICLVFLFSSGCSTKENEHSLLSGSYYAVGDYEKQMTPYLYLNTESNECYLGAGAVVSFAAHGTYQVKEDNIIAETQIATFVFEIEDSKTVVLIDNGDSQWLRFPTNTEFVYSEEIK